MFYQPLVKRLIKHLKKYFDEIVPKRNLIHNKCYIRKTKNIEDPVKKSIIQGSESSYYNKYQRHYKIKNISSQLPACFNRQSERYD